MPFDASSFSDLMADTTRMAARIDADATGAPTAKKILKAAAQPIHQQMKANASHDPVIRSGDLNEALKIGDVKKRRGKGQRVTIGVHRKDWNNEEYYPAYVEYGHGGPAPAPPHPYIRPAYDTRQDEAFEIIRQGLRDAIDKL